MEKFRCISLPTEYPSLPGVNAYLFTGEPVTLIDTGPYCEKAWNELVSALSEEGMKPKDIEQIILTHPHWDHFGLTRQICKHSKATVYAHPDGEYPIEHLDDYWDRWIEVITSLFKHMAVPEEKAQPHLAYLSVRRDYTQPAKIHQFIKEGDSIRLGHHSWEIIETPGHCRGSICLFCRETNTIISGDTVIKGVLAIPMLEPRLFPEQDVTESIVHYIESLNRLIELEVDEVLPGHGAPFKEGKNEIIKNLNYCNKRQEQILHLVRTKSPCTGWDIFQVLFPNLPDENLFMPITEIWCYLYLLGKAGKVGYNKDGQKLLFQYLSW